MRKAKPKAPAKAPAKRKAAAKPKAAAKAPARPKVPDGHTPFYTTRQMKPNAKGFVGYETIWQPFQKEAKYKTPKRP